MPENFLTPEMFSKQPSIDEVSVAAQQAIEPVEDIYLDTAYIDNPFSKWNWGRSLYKSAKETTGLVPFDTEDSIGEVKGKIALLKSEQVNLADSAVTQEEKDRRTQEIDTEITRLFEKQNNIQTDIDNLGIDISYLQKQDKFNRDPNRSLLNPEYWYYGLNTDLATSGASMVKFIEVAASAQGLKLLGNTIAKRALTGGGVGAVAGLLEAGVGLLNIYTTYKLRQEEALAETGDVVNQGMQQFDAKFLEEKGIGTINEDSPYWNEYKEKAAAREKELYKDVDSIYNANMALGIIDYVQTAMLFPGFSGLTRFNKFTKFQGLGKSLFGNNFWGRVAIPTATAAIVNPYLEGIEEVNQGLIQKSYIDGTLKADDFWEGAKEGAKEFVNANKLVWGFNNEIEAKEREQLMDNFYAGFNSSLLLGSATNLLNVTRDRYNYVNVKNALQKYQDKVSDNNTFVVDNALVYEMLSRGKGDYFTSAVQRNEAIAPESKSEIIRRFNEAKEIFDNIDDVIYTKGYSVIGTDYKKIQDEKGEIRPSIKKASFNIISQIVNNNNSIRDLQGSTAKFDTDVEKFRNQGIDEETIDKLREENKKNTEAEIEKLEKENTFLERRFKDEATGKGVKRFNTIVNEKDETKREKVIKDFIYDDIIRAEESYGDRTGIYNTINNFTITGLLTSDIDSPENFQEIATSIFRNQIPLNEVNKVLLNIKRDRLNRSILTNRTDSESKINQVLDKVEERIKQIESLGEIEFEQELELQQLYSAIETGDLLPLQGIFSSELDEVIENTKQSKKEQSTVAMIESLLNVFNNAPTKMETNTNGVVSDTFFYPSNGSYNILTGINNDLTPQILALELNNDGKIEDDFSNLRHSFLRFREFYTRTVNPKLGKASVYKFLFNQLKQPYYYLLELEANPLLDDEKGLQSAIDEIDSLSEYLSKNYEEEYNNVTPLLTAIRKRLVEGLSEVKKNKNTFERQEQIYINNIKTDLSEVLNTEITDNKELYNLLQNLSNSADQSAVEILKIEYDRLTRGLIGTASEIENAKNNLNISGNMLGILGFRYSLSEQEAIDFIANRLEKTGNDYIDNLTKIRSIEFALNIANSGLDIKKFLRDVNTVTTKTQFAPNHQQFNLLLQIITNFDKNNNFIVSGFAGSGKTSTVQYLYEILQQRGISKDSFIITAQQDEIKNNLKDKFGIEPQNIEQLNFDGKRILIIDEAESLNYEFLKRTIDQANKAGLKTILLGDPNQITENIGNNSGNFYELAQLPENKSFAPLTIVHRTDILAIKNYQNRFIAGNNFNIPFIGTVNRELTEGLWVKSLDEAFAAYEANAAQYKNKTRVFIIAESNIAEFSKRKPSIEFKTAKEVQGIEYDEVYIYLPYKVSGNDLYNFLYKKENYVASTRAKKIIIHAQDSTAQNSTVEQVDKEIKKDNSEVVANFIRDINETAQYIKSYTKEFTITHDDLLEEAPEKKEEVTQQDEQREVVEEIEGLYENNTEPIKEGVRSEPQISSEISLDVEATNETPSLPDAADKVEAYIENTVKTESQLEPLSLDVEVQPVSGSYNVDNPQLEKVTQKKFHIGSFEDEQSSNKALRTFSSTIKKYLSKKDVPLKVKVVYQKSTLPNGKVVDDLVLYNSLKEGNRQEDFFLASIFSGDLSNPDSSDIDVLNFISTLDVQKIREEYDKTPSVLNDRSKEIKSVEVGETDIASMYYKGTINVSSNTEASAVNTDLLTTMVNQYAQNLFQDYGNNAYNPETIKASILVNAYAPGMEEKRTKRINELLGIDNRPEKGRYNGQMDSDLRSGLTYLVLSGENLNGVRDFMFVQLIPKKVDTTSNLYSVLRDAIEKAKVTADYINEISNGKITVDRDSENLLDGLIRTYNYIIASSDLTQEQRDRLTDLAHSNTPNNLGFYVAFKQAKGILSTYAASNTNLREGRLEGITEITDDRGKIKKYYPYTYKDLLDIYNSFDANTGKSNYINPNASTTFGNGIFENIHAATNFNIKVQRDGEYFKVSIGDIENKERVEENLSKLTNITEKIVGTSLFYKNLKAIAPVANNNTRGNSAKTGFKKAKEKRKLKSNNFGLATVINEKNAIQLLKRYLPNRSPELLRYLSEQVLRYETNGRTQWGYSYNNIIAVRDLGGKTTYRELLLHEIFHDLFNNYLTPEERKQLTKNYREQYNSKENDESVEEHLADLFAEGYEDRTSLIGKIKELILKLLDALGIITRDADNIKNFFKRLDKGEFDKELGLTNPIKFKDEIKNMSAEDFQDTYNTIVSNLALDHFQLLLDIDSEYESFSETIKDAYLTYYSQYKELLDKKTNGELHALDERKLKQLELLDINTDGKLFNEIIKDAFGLEAKIKVIDNSKGELLDLDVSLKNSEINNDEEDFDDYEEDNTEANINKLDNIASIEYKDPSKNLSSSVKFLLNFISAAGKITKNSKSVHLSLMEMMSKWDKTESLPSFLERNLSKKYEGVLANNEIIDIIGDRIPYKDKILLSLLDIYNKASYDYKDGKILIGQKYQTKFKKGKFEGTGLFLLDTVNDEFVSSGNIYDKINSDQYKKIKYKKTEGINKFIEKVSRVYLLSEDEEENLRRDYRKELIADYFNQVYSYFGSLTYLNPKTLFVENTEEGVRIKHLTTSKQDGHYFVVSTLENYRTLFEKDTPIETKISIAAALKKVNDVKLPIEDKDKYSYVQNLQKEVFAGTALQEYILSLDSAKDSANYIAALKAYLQEINVAINNDKFTVKAKVSGLANYLSGNESKSQVLSVLGEAGKKIYLYVNGSYFNDIFREYRRDYNKLKSGIFENFFSHNPFLNGSSSISDINYFHKLRNEQTERENTYSNEGFHEYFGRVLNSGFGYSLGNNSPNGKFLIFPYIISDKPKTYSMEVPFIKEADQLKWAKGILYQLANRPDYNNSNYNKNKNKIDIYSDFSLNKEDILKDEVIDESLVETKAKEILSRIEKEADKFYDILKESGFVYTGTIKIELERYYGFVESKEKIDDLEIEDIKKRYIREFYLQSFLNSYFANQIFFGDSALAKSNIDIIKRMAGVFAPGLVFTIDENTGLNKNMKHIIFKAPVYKYEESNDYSGKFENIYGSTIEYADSASYGSLQAHLDEEKAISSVGEIANIKKNVYYGRTIDNVPYYIKSAETLLSVKFIRTFPMFEKLANDLADSNISSAAEENSVKIGKNRVANSINNTSDELVETILTNGKRQQQRVALPINKDNAVKGLSQIFYELLNNGLNDTEANNIYEALSDIIENNIEHAKLKFSIKDEQYNSEDTKRKIISYLHNKLKDSPNSINADLLVIDGSDFYNVLEIPGIVDKTASTLVKSLYKDFYEVKFKGLKAQLAPSYGIHVFDTDNGITTFDKLSDEQKQDARAVYDKINEVAESYPQYFSDFYNALQDYIKAGRYNKLTQFKESNTYFNRLPDDLKSYLLHLQGQVLPRELEYFDKENYVEVVLPNVWKKFGFKEEDLIDSQYLTGFAFRLPSSDLHSGMAFKIVGFYTDNDTNIAFAPKEIVKLHGSDNDADALNIIFRSAFSSLKDSLIDVSKNKGDIKVGEITYTKGQIVGLDFEKELRNINSVIAKNPNSQELRQLKNDILKTRIVEQLIKVYTDEKNLEDLTTPISLDMFYQAPEGEDEQDLKQDIERTEEEKLQMLHNKTPLLRILNTRHKSIVRGSKGHPADVIASQKYMEDNNAGGKSMVGIDGNSGKMIYLGLGKQLLDENEAAISLRINGVEYNQTSRETKNINGEEIRKVSEIQDGAMNASTDGAKENINSPINKNSYTGYNYATANRLGVPLNYMGVILDHPIVRLYAKTLKNSYANVPVNLTLLGSKVEMKGKDAVLDIIRKSIDSELNRRDYNYNKPTSSDYNLNVDTLYLDSNSYELSDYSNEQLENLLHLTYFIESLNKATEIFKEPIQPLKALNSPFSTIEGIIETEAKFKRLTTDYPVNDDLMDYAHIRSTINFVSFVSNLVQSNISLYNKHFQDYLSTVYKSLRIEGERKEKIKQRLNTGLYSYLLSDYPVFNRPDATITREGVEITGINANKELIIDKLLKLKNKNPNNIFLSLLHTSPKNYKGKDLLRKLYINKRDSSELLFRLAKTALQDLINNNDIDTNDLLYYLYHEYNLNFQFNSFADLINPIEYKDFLAYVSDNIQGKIAEFMANEQKQVDFFYQFVSNNSNQLDSVYGFTGLQRGFVLRTGISPAYFVVNKAKSEEQKSYSKVQMRIGGGIVKKKIEGKEVSVDVSIYKELLAHYSENYQELFKEDLLYGLDNQIKVKLRFNPMIPHYYQKDKANLSMADLSIVRDKSVKVNQVVGIHSDYYINDAKYFKITAVTEDGELTGTSFEITKDFIDSSYENFLNSQEDLVRNIKDGQLRKAAKQEADIDKLTEVQKEKQIKLNKYCNI